METRARARIETVKTKTQGLTPVKVFFMEWVDPIYCGGHWMPEMIGWAGGVDTISKPNVDSIRIAWEDVLKWDPEVLVISPCGYNTAKSLEQTELLKSRSNWNDLKAVKNKRVYAVDGNSYFARPGLRLVDGTELLAHLIHPELFDWKGRADAFAPAQI